VYIEDTLEEFLNPFNTKDEVDLSVKSKLENGKNNIDAIDEKYYSLRKFIKLCSDCNPNIFEMLYSPKDCIEYIDPLFKKYFIDNPEMFLNKKVVDRFIGYAKSQEQRSYTKSENYIALDEFKNILDKYTISTKLSDICSKFDHLGNSITKHHSSTNIESYIVIGEMEFSYNLRVKDAYERIEDRFSRASHRVDGMLINRYEPKFMSHTVRLLIEGIQLLQTHKILLPFTGYEKDIIMKIKLGKTPVEDIPKIVNTYKEIFSRNENEYSKNLQQTPDYNKIRSCFYNFILETFLNKGDN